MESDHSEDDISESDTISTDEETDKDVDEDISEVEDASERSFDLISDSSGEFSLDLDLKLFLKGIYKMLCISDTVNDRELRFMTKYLGIIFICSFLK